MQTNQKQSSTENSLEKHVNYSPEYSNRDHALHHGSFYAFSMILLGEWNVDDGSI